LEHDFIKIENEKVINLVVNLETRFFEVLTPKKTKLQNI